MTDLFIATGVIMLGLMLPALYRVAAGPTPIDRIVAINVIGTKTAVLLVVIGTVFGQVEMFVDFALAYGLLNFVGSLAAARYFHRTKAMPVDSGAETETETGTETGTGTETETGTGTESHRYGGSEPAGT